ncbi:MAG: hypothetical protein AB7R90_21010 [Reyranellaceae bacterium]
MSMTPFELLAAGWPGQQYSCRDVGAPVADEADWQARVDWEEGNSLAKPTLAEVEARREELEYKASRVMEVTPLQLRRALRSIGLKAEVDAFLAQAGEEAQEAWEYAVTINRNDALIAAAAQELGKTDQEIDALFALAAIL